MDQMNNTKMRQSNFELMGIILMLLIIAEHVVMYCDKLSNVGSIDYYIANFTQSFCMIAANVYILRSGYFGMNFKWKKLLSLDLRVCFYTWILFVIALIFNIHELNIIKDIKMLFPVITKQYWFITAYVALYALSPFINKFLTRITKQELKYFLLVGYLIFYIIPTFCFTINAEQLVPDAGYGIVNFVFLYCTGYYLKNYHTSTKSKYFYLMIYIIFAFVIFILNHTISIIFNIYFNSYISYNVIFNLIGAIGLFLAFSKIKLRQNKLINKLSSKTLIVYIIHMNPTFSKYLFQEIFHVNKLSSINLVLSIILIPVIIYISCFIIDLVADIVLIPLERIIIDISMRIKIKTIKKIKS